jgi:hypothetical protein
MIALSAFAVAAAAGPPFVATMIWTPAPEDYQASPGQCLAWYGNKEDGICLGTSNGTPINAGTPDFGVWGPGYGQNGIGISTGPLLPGQTINRPIG